MVRRQADTRRGMGLRDGNYRRAGTQHVGAECLRRHRKPAEPMLDRDLSEAGDGSRAGGSGSLPAARANLES